MLIQQRRIRNVASRLGFIKQGTELVICLPGLDQYQDVLTRMGLTDRTIGQAVLPAAVFGPISRFNAHGTWIVHKDRPMETAHRMREWHWQQWRGRYDREWVSRYVDVPYQRYPRTFVPPPSVELCVTATTERCIHPSGSCDCLYN